MNQIPIYCQDYYKKRPFLYKHQRYLDKLPCASFLVRCYKAAEEDGKVLGIKSGIAQKEWAERGIWHFKPDYRLKGYCSKECNVNKSEELLFLALEKDKGRKNKNGKFATVPMLQKLT